MTQRNGHPKQTLRGGPQAPLPEEQGAAHPSVVKIQYHNRAPRTLTLAAPPPLRWERHSHHPRLSPPGGGSACSASAQSKGRRLAKAS